MARACALHAQGPRFKSWLAHLSVNLYLNNTMKKKHSLQEIENILRDLKPLLKEQFKVKRIGIFGSYLKGKERKSSDIDILIDFFEEPSFFKFIELEEFLTKKLGVKVDLVIKDTLKPRIKKIILQEILFL